MCELNGDMRRFCVHGAGDEASGKEFVLATDKLSDINRFQDGDNSPIKRGHSLSFLASIIISSQQHHNNHILSH